MTHTLQDPQVFSFLKFDGIGAYRQSMDPRTGRELMTPSGVKPPTERVTEQQ